MGPAQCPPHVVLADLHTALNRGGPTHQADPPLGAAGAQAAYSTLEVVSTGEIAEWLPEATLSQLIFAPIAVHARHPDWHRAHEDSVYGNGSWNGMGWDGVNDGME